MKIRVRALALPVFALGLACSTSGSHRTARSGQGASTSGTASSTASGASGSAQASGGVGSQDATGKTMNEGVSGSADASSSMGGSSPSAVAGDLKGHSSDQLVTGRVMDVSGKTLTIQSDEGTPRELALVDQTVVQMDGRDATASDLKPGQDVRASFNDVDGKPVAVKIEVASTSSGMSGTGSSGSMDSTGSTGSSSTAPGELPATPSDGSAVGDPGRGGLSNPSTGSVPPTPPDGKTGTTDSGSGTKKY